MKPKSTKTISQDLVDEIKKAISNIKWGSIEIFVQDSMVVQITERSIKKMSERTKER